MQIWGRGFINVYNNYNDACVNIEQHTDYF